MFFVKIKVNRKEAEQRIKNFFNRDKFSADDVRKIKRLAMKFNIKLGEYRKSFCGKCMSPLHGKLRINKGYKTVECASCGFKNRWKI